MKVKNSMTVNLKDRDWKEFSIGELFDVSGTKTTRPERLIKGGKTPRITTSATNNGLDNTYKNEPTERGGVITVDSATFGFVSYQEADFIATDHVEKISMKSNNKMDRYLGMFLVQSIKYSTAGEYAYGYKFSQGRIRRQKILLPVTQTGDLDYNFMRKYMKEKEQEKLKQYLSNAKERARQIKNYLEVQPLKEKKWNIFRIDYIFTEIKRGKRLKKNDHIKGNKPYISSTGINNGVDSFVGNKENVRVFSNNLTIANSGSVGSCFYQPFEFVASDHVHSLKLKNDNTSEYVYKFISTIASRLKDKYSFNYEISDDRIKRENILLPTNQKNEPDYEYMENYMKKLEYEKIKQYLQYISTRYN